VSGDSDLYGKDVLFDGNDFVITAQSDYATIEGVENVRLALYRRLATRPGEYRYKPNYGAGLGTFVKKKMTKTTRDEMTHRVTEQVAQERRVEELLQVSFDKDEANQKITLYLKVKLFGRAVAFAPMTFAEAA
jgi:phage baseplate assembly protein W